MKYGQMDIDSRNNSIEDRKSARSKDMDHANVTEYKDRDPVKDRARDAIATLATMNGSARRSKSSKMPTRAKNTKDVDDIGQGRKDSLEKRILTTSQTMKAPESLHCPESRRSISEDNVTQKEMKLSEKRTEFAINDDDERISNLNMRLEYFRLGLHDRLKISEIDKLLEIINQIEGRSANILLDIEYSIYILSSNFAKRNEIQEIQMRS